MSEWGRNGALFGKQSKKINRIFGWIILVSFVIILITYLMHDIRLSAEIIKLGFTNVPEIRIENIRFERDILGSIWRINIPSLERQDGVIKIFSIDVLRELSNGDIWEISGENGEYIENSEIAEFNGISGRIVLDGQVFELNAPCITWEKNDDLIVLSKGISVNGEFASLSANKAKVEAGNFITIEEGGEIIWNISSYDIKI